MGQSRIHREDMAPLKVLDMAAVLDTVVDEARRSLIRFEGLV